MFVLTGSSGERLYTCMRSKCLPRVCLIRVRTWSEHYLPIKVRQAQICFDMCAVCWTIIRSEHVFSLLFGFEHHKANTRHSVRLVSRRASCCLVQPVNKSTNEATSARVYSRLSQYFWTHCPIPITIYRTYVGWNYFKNEPTFQSEIQ